MTMDYSPWVEREILAIFEDKKKGAITLKPERVTPTKIGFHEFHINPLLA